MRILSSWLLVFLAVGGFSAVLLPTPHDRRELGFRERLDENPAAAAWSIGFLGAAIWIRRPHLRRSSQASSSRICGSRCEGSGA